MAQTRLLISFSKKNIDVFEILEQKKKENVIITDYICECIRYYEQKHNEKDKDSVEETVKKVIANMLVNGSMPVATVNSDKEENKEETIIEEKPKGYAALEDITDDVISFMNNFEDD